MPKNTYLEINDLMEFLSTQDLECEKANSSKVPFTDILCLSINTIKTHNRRIFSKLNVSSRKELMIYINRMEELKSDD